MEVGSEILKVDEAGRVRTPPEKREVLLAEYDRSGMTGAQFARFVGVRYSTLMYWLQRRRRRPDRRANGNSEAGSSHWLEARGRLNFQSENIVVEIGGGVRMVVGNRAQAALAGELLRAMGLVRGC